MPDAKANPARDKAIAEAKANQKKAVEGRIAAEEAAELSVAGYEETLPGQEEVVAGTPEHVAVLNAYPNATSYGPDVNVVVPPEPPPPDPPSTLAGAMSGSTLSGAAAVHHDTRADTKAGSRASRDT